MAVRVTESGELTISADIVARAGFTPGTKVTFIIDGQTIHLHREPLPPHPGRGAELIARIAGSGDFCNLTTDEILAMTRGEY